MAKARKKTKRNAAAKAGTAPAARKASARAKAVKGGVRGAGSGVRERRASIEPKAGKAGRKSPTKPPSKRAPAVPAKTGKKTKATGRGTRAPAKAATATTGAKAKERYVDRGAPLPTAYGENRIVAVARDAEHIFIYWDVHSDVRIADRPLIVRIFCVTDDLSFEFHPPPDADNWYFRVTPDRTYRFDLLARDADGGWSLLARSREVTTPRRRPASAEPPTDLLPAEVRPPARTPPERPLPARAAEAGAMTPPATFVPDARTMTAPWTRQRAAESVLYPRQPQADNGRRKIEAMRPQAGARLPPVAERPPRPAWPWRGAEAAPDRRSPAPPPVPVPTPAETIFAAQYAQGGGK
jgi:hypothetical protein